jgi:hypothetical protein
MRRNEMNGAAITLTDLIISPDWKRRENFSLDKTAIHKLEGWETSASSTPSTIEEDDIEENSFNHEIDYVDSPITQEKEAYIKQNMQQERAQLLAELENIMLLGDSWSDEVKGPNDYVISYSRNLIEQFLKNSFVPSRLTQSIEEGMSFVFMRNKLFFYLEIYNDKEMGVLIEDYDNKKVLINKEVNSQHEILEVLSEFYNTI